MIEIIIAAALTVIAISEVIGVIYNITFQKFTKSILIKQNSQLKVQYNELLMHNNKVLAHATKLKTGE